MQRWFINSIKADVSVGEICFNRTMKYIIGLFFFASSVHGAESFESLPETHGVHYNQELGAAFEISDEEFNDGKPFLRTRISTRNPVYYLFSFDMGPSEDPTFQIFEEQKGKEPMEIGSINANRVYIPGSGFLYSSGTTNSYFDKRRKWELKDRKLFELKQPFYAVAVSTETKEPITLWSDPKKAGRVAELPKGYSVEIVLSDDEEKRFLVRTGFGLVGWYLHEKGTIETPFKELKFNGD